jgi:K+-sensing histidine kinase KdpD
MNVSSLSRSQDRLVAVGAVLAPFAVSGALVPVRHSFPNADGALLLVAVTVAFAAYGQRAAGLLAAASSAIWFDFFLTAPYEHFTITRRADIETTILLIVVGAAVTELAVRGRRHRVRADTGARYLAAIGAVSRPAATGGSAPEVTREAAARLTELLGLQASHFEQSSYGGLPRLERDGRVRAGNSYIDVEANGWPSSSIELLVQTNDRTAGRFVLEPRPGAAVSLEARQVAAVLAGQVAAAITDHVPAHR